jgi:flagellar biogenesis protein FliO
MNADVKTMPLGGLAGWLLGRMRIRQRATPRLVMLERITLAPRQSLALVEVEGRRLLVATSPEGAPVFFPLDEPARPRSKSSPTARISW